MIAGIYLEFIRGDLGEIVLTTFNGGILPGITLKVMREDVGMILKNKRQPFRSPNPIRFQEKKIEVLVHHSGQTQSF